MSSLCHETKTKWEWEPAERAVVTTQEENKKHRMKRMSWHDSQAQALSSFPTAKPMRPLTKAYNRWLVAVIAILICLATLATPRSTLKLKQPFRALSAPLNDAETTPPAKTFTDQVRFDNYSLIVRGQRVFLYSGEFHTFRLPVPSLWPDIMQKFKAAGLNGVSIYTHWGLSNPSRGVVDFDGFRALEPLYEAAMDAGIWVVVRPGPYINAETTAGGIAHWVTSEIAGELRTNDTDFRESWEDYIQGIITHTEKWQITEGGPVIAIQIDNEFTQEPAHAAYFAQLEEVYHSSNIVVPLTYNDPGMGRNFINGTGAVDLYGLDSYPQRFDCSNPTSWNPVTTNYHEYHEDANPSQPFYFPEFQGGSFDAWGPTAPGYEACRELTGADFESVFYLQLWAANAKLISYYMVYGGTSWGAIPFHGVYTSYDYGASITESRSLTPKYTELKKQALFLRSSPEFYKTDWVSDTRTTTFANIPQAFVTFLRNPDTGAGFYIARQANSSSTDTINFEVTTSAATVPLTLVGRQSKLILTSYSFGEDSIVDYSTASVLFAGVIGTRDVLFLHGDVQSSHEVSIHLTGAPTPFFAQPSNYAFTKHGNSTTVNVLAGTVGLVTLWDSDEQLVLYADGDTAGTFWAPTLSSSNSSTDPFANFWQFGTNDTVLVGGPWLVRSASIDGTGVLALKGDLKDGVSLSVIAPSTVVGITWNGQAVESLKDTQSSSSIIQAELMTSARIQGISVPTLGPWKFHDSLPEIQSEFDDAEWIEANNTVTNIPFKPFYGDGRVLYGCDYGFCENIVLWRGHFNGTEDQKSVNLSINGGEAFAASVWLNDVFLDTAFGNSTNNRNSIEETDDVFVFPKGSVLVGEDNIITIVQDNMGLNETESGDTNASKGPRGIRGFQLDSGEFGSWKVQGKIGGYTDYPDKVRGVFNEGGLFAERAGFHLPSAPDISSWPSEPSITGTKPGVGFFVTTFNLSIETGLDVRLSFDFTEGEGQAYRAILFVNGWMMGKRVANLGPQSKFPVHEGILDYHGLNTVALALWTMLPNTTVTPKLELLLDEVVEGGVGGVIVNNPPWDAAGREVV